MQAIRNWRTGNEARHVLVSGEQPSTETWIWLYTHRVVSIETQSKVPQCRKQFRFYHPGKERRDCNGTGSQFCGRSSPCDGIVHALVDSGQHPPIALANVVDVCLQKQVGK